MFDVIAHSVRADPRVLLKEGWLVVLADFEVLIDVRQILAGDANGRAASATVPNSDVDTGGGN